MKRTILNVLLLLFVINSASAQSLEELNSRRLKERTRTQSISIPSNIGRPQHPLKLDADDTTWGMGYSYSKHFPLALNANYTISYFSIGGELGVNFDKKKIVRSETETDYPIMYVLVAPGFYCKYFSINCGVGALAARNQQSWSTTYETSGSVISISRTVNGINEKSKWGFLLKPSIVGYIPISDSGYYITLNVGYIYIPKFKELNGFSFGVGFQVEL